MIGSAESYASLLQECGHHVVRTASAWWYEAHPRWYQAIPMHVELAPSDAELDAVFGHGALVLRYTCPISAGSPTYRSVCSDPAYDLATLGSTARRATRRGLERCTVRRIGFAELEPIGGLDLSRSTLVRQGRRVSADHDRYWRGHFAAAARSNIAECWGAFVGDELAAFLIAVTVDDCVYLPLLKSSTDHLADYPNNALVYSFTRDALGRQGVVEVSWGLESLLQGLDGLERFKLGMGYAQRPIGQRIEMRSWLRAALRGPATRVVHRLAARGTAGHTIDRAAETLRRHDQQPPRSRVDR